MKWLGVDSAPWSITEANTTPVDSVQPFNSTDKALSFNIKLVFISKIHKEQLTRNWKKTTNAIKKRAKDLNIHLTNENIQVANKLQRDA